MLAKAISEKEDYLQQIFNRQPSCLSTRMNSNSSNIERNNFADIQTNMVRGWNNDKKEEEDFIIKKQQDWINMKTHIELHNTPYLAYTKAKIYKNDKYLIPYMRQLVETCLLIKRQPF